MRGNASTTDAYSARGGREDPHDSELHTVFYSDPALASRTGPSASTAATLGGGDDTAKEGEYGDRLRVNLTTIDDTTAPEPVAQKPSDREPVVQVDDDADIVPPLTGGASSGPHHHHHRPRKGIWLALDQPRRAFNVLVPYGGLLSCSFNLASATLGAGIISLPSAFNLSGIVMACVYLVLVTAGTVYSMNLLAKVMVRTGFTTYSMAARKLLGVGTDYFLATLIIILCFGGSVAYIIAMSTLLDPVLKSPGSPDFLKTKQGNQVITSLVWLVLMLPLVIPKHINSLRYVSTFGVLFIVYFVVCIIVHSVTHGMKDPEARGKLVPMRTGNAALEGLGSFLFAFMCQLNAFEIFAEQTRPTVFYFTLYSTISMVTCAVLYFLAGYFGYADFGERVRDSVLTLYDPVSEPYIAVGYIGIVVKICAAFALHMIPFRDALYHFFRWNAATVPYWKHALVMAVPATAALLCGLFIPTINTVLGLLGSFCGGIIGMVMPALFFMYCGNFSVREVGWVNYIATYLLLIGGVVAVVFGTVTTVYSTVQNSFK